MDAQASKRASRWRRRLIFLLIVLIGVLLVVLPFGMGFTALYTMTRPICRTYPTPQQAYNLAYETVQFSEDGRQHQAYFIPGPSEAVVIIAPPFSGDAGSHLNYANLFHQAGLSVLTMESRACQGDPQTIGYAEGDDVRAAYTYLATRDDVDPNRVSVHGFSAGGAAALFGAARAPGIRGVSAMGNYDDFHEDFGQAAPGDNIVERMFKHGASLGYRAGAGFPTEVLRPISIIEDIAPRPILFVYGTEEPGLGGGYRMLALAGGNSQLWEVPGVGHGGYLERYPQESADIIGGFHRDLLLNTD